MATADSIVRLKVENSEYDAKIKRAAQGLQHMEEACRKTGSILTHLEDENRDFIRSLGKMETASKSARGRVGELTTAFTDLKAMYNRLSEEEKNSEFGKELNKQLNILKGRVRDAKSELKGINKELGGPGGFNSMLEQLGGKLGINSDLMGMVTGGTLAYTAAIGAAAVAVEKAAEAWAKYNSEIAKQDQITTVTTGLKGGDAEAMTDQVRAIAATYNVEFRDAINAANTLMSQFGASGQEAINLIKDGMQGMIAGDGPKLLQMIQQYAPAFRDAGIEASQLIAIIHNTEGGIFTDQNMNAIVMGIKNIRMMKDTTKEAMKSIGIDADSMAKKLNDGTMSVFDALREVSGKIEEVGSGSQAAGEIMNDIFGKQGVAAGTNLGKAIETLNLNLDETKLQTDKVGSAMAELQTANEQLNAQIRKTFGYKGWEEMEIGLKVKLVNAVTNVLTAVEKVENAFNTCKSYYDKFESAVSQSKVASIMMSIYRAVENAVVPFKLIYEYVYKIFDALGQTPNVKVPRVSGGGTPQGNTSRDNIGSSTGGGNTGGSSGKGGREAKTPDIYAEDSIRAQEKLVADLTDKWKRAGADVKDGYKVQLDAATQKLNEMLGKTKEVKDAMTTGKSFDASNAGISWLIGDIKTQLDNAELGSTLYDELTSQLADATTFKNVVEQWANAGLGMADLKADKLWQQLFAGENIPDDTWKSLAATINAKLRELGIDPIVINFKTGSVEKVKEDSKEISTEWNAAGNAISAVSNALNQIEDPAAKVMGTIAQAIATVALSYAQALSASTAAGPWAWLAFAATGAATMMSSISAIRSATSAGSFADGGIVPGNSFSGDNLTAHVNSGELILNHAQQNNLARDLQQSSSNGGSTGKPYVTGETMWLGISNFINRTGRGEIITSKNISKYIH